MESNLYNSAVCILLHVNTCSGPELQHAQEIGAALRRIGDELDGDQHLQRYECPHCPDLLLIDESQIL